ncbi:hypothetical protein M8818_004501 [Zalaria obscura]|uniref:Uncharacterized protein n=1 Tax=Zalaria obscura TaxID=2024903 RepID=A0ACC3SBT6_9PEZI
MAPSQPPQNIAAQPSRTTFDPWNSSSTGHQRAENRLSGSTSWRESRSLKLGEQFRSGSGGGRRLYDTVGAGSEEFGKDGRKENGGWEKGAKGLRKGGQLSLWESLGGAKVRKEVEREVGKETGERMVKRVKVEEDREDGPPFTQTIRQETQEQVEGQEQEHNRASEKPPQIFANLTVCINGSTAPLMSDHKLKRLLVSHGANLSIALGRRTVTHVILGHPSSSSNAKGAGGGLSGSKIQKEIANVRGKGVKFVSAEWVIESVKAGKRVGEARFEALRLAPKGVASVASMFGAAKREGG